jgi:hypothetical protein
MKRLTILTSIGLGLGLALGLLWLLGGDFLTVKAQGLDGISTYYVAPGGNCGVASPCYSTVQVAVDAADHPNDVIKVAAGTYTDINSYGGLSQVVYIDKTVTIRGGYTIADWNTPDPDTNPTTLDAQRQGRVMFITGDIYPTIEGLRITGGDATGLGGKEGWTSDLGGGMHIIAATAAIGNSRIFSNTADQGGGLYLLGSSASLDGNAIFSNTAQSGGGVSLYESDATLAGNTISSNTSTVYGGGGLYLSSSDAVLIGNIISSNTDKYNGGGGLFLTFSNATLNGNTVSTNTTWGSGGGLYLYESAATLSGNTISFNEAPFMDGGGIYLQGSDAKLSGNTVSHNVAEQRGGGAYLEHSDATLTGNIVFSNTADYGGGMFLFDSNATLANNSIADNRATDQGSGLFVDRSRPHLFHTTIACNSGGDGSGIHVSRVVVSPGGESVVAMTNTILVSHTVGIYVGEGSTATLESTLWHGNGSDWGGIGTIETGAPTHNHWGDPAFVDPDNGDYHIGPGSAAIDVGIAAGISADIDQEPRIGTPDLGADEYWAPGALKRVFLPLVLRQYP